MAKYEFVLDQAAEGQRIDACVRRFLPELPQPTVRESFRRRDVKLDGKRVPPETRVRGGQTVAVFCMEQAADPIEVVYEDADVLLVNKRAGVSVVPDDGSGASLIELAHRHLLLADATAQPPRPCHRLDNPTSGLCLLAKNDRAEEVLVRAFRDRTLEKRYTCLVRGMMKPPAATCRAWLRKDAEAARVTIHDEPVAGSKPIITAYETMESGPVSRLSVHLITGRTHQIRAHMAALGHPLLGDDLYGDRGFNRQQKARRLMLCATSLTVETGGALPQLDGRTFTVRCPF